MRTHPFRYFLRGSAEERLIAYRTREATDGAADALSVLATAGDATKMPHHKLRYIAGLTPFAQDGDIQVAGEDSDDSSIISSD